MADLNKYEIHALLEDAGVRKRRNKWVYPMNVAKEKLDGDALLKELHKGHVLV